MIITAPTVGIIAAVTLKPPAFTTESASTRIQPRFTRPALKIKDQVKVRTSKPRKIDTLTTHWLDEMREETLFSPLYEGKRSQISYALTSNSSKRIAQRRDLKLNKPLSILTYLPTTITRVVLSLVIGAVFKVLVYPIYIMSLGYSKLQ